MPSAAASLSITLAFSMILLFKKLDDTTFIDHLHTCPYCVYLSIIKITTCKCVTLLLLFLINVPSSQLKMQWTNTVCQSSCIFHVPFLKGGYICKNGKYFSDVMSELKSFLISIIFFSLMKIVSAKVVEFRPIKFA